MSTPTIKTHEEDEPASFGEFCGICRRQVSRYTCPSCNLFYCSLSCFRSESHSQCSETFYRKEIEVGIKAGTSKSEDRNKMLELLKRIQDESTADEAAVFHPSDEETEEDSLGRRFSGIDISSASTNDILRLLNEKEKATFFAALKDPSSGLVQELLGSAEFEKTRRLPWWEAPADESQSLPSSGILYGARPDLIEIPDNLINQVSQRTPLLYNIFAVLLAYAFVTRHLSISPLSSAANDPVDQHQARDILLQSVPFLKDRKSKLLYLSLNDAVISFWSRLHSGTIDKRTMLVLLEDVERLVRPGRIVAAERLSLEENEDGVSLTTKHPFSTIIMAISDMSSLFGTPLDPSVARRSSHIVMKLTFYATYILSTPSSHLHALADNVHAFSEKMAREAH